MRKFTEPGNNRVYQIRFGDAAKRVMLLRRAFSSQAFKRMAYSNKHTGTQAQPDYRVYFCMCFNFISIRFLHTILPLLAYTFDHH